MRLVNRVFVPSLLLLAVPTGHAQESLAERFPADAILYVEADSRRLMEGTLALDLVKLLDEEQVQQFLEPVKGELPVELSTRGLRAMIDSVPWRRFVDGRVEIAVRGFRIDVDGQAFEISPSKPIDARQVNRLIALAGSYADDRGPGPDVRMTADAVVRIDAGDGFEAWFDEMLRHLEQAGLRKVVEGARIGGRDATRISIRIGGDEAPMQSFHVVRDGRRWWIGGSPATLERCLKGGAQESLAGSRAFQNFRKQVSSVDPALLAYVNVANAARILERLVPPIVKEELDLFGISSIEALGVASTFVEGGVRDSLAITFAAPPAGLVSLLQCTEGGFRFLKKAPVETGLYLGARVDPEGFVDKLAKVLEELFPGSSGPLESGMAEASRELGMDLRQELLPAFGDEVGVYLTSPGAGSILPEGMVMLAVGDREQFEKLLARGLEVAGAQGVQATAIKSLPEGCKGWSIASPDFPLQPAIAVTNDFCCVAPNVIALKKSLKEMQGGLAQCAADNVNVGRVLRGLTGAPNANGLSLLAFIDLQKLVEFGYQFAPMAPLQQWGLPLDLAQMPETEVVARHFSGIGVAGRSDTHGLSLSFFSPTGLLSGNAVALPLLLHRAEASVVRARAPTRARPAPEPAAEPAQAPRTSGSTKTRSLADLFANIEKATGATIDFPASLGETEVAYTPRSGNLETILAELGRIAGFTFELRDVDGEKLVVVSGG